MEVILGATELGVFIVSTYQFVRWQRRQTRVLEFIDFVQKATVFNPSLLKTVLDVNGPTIYHKSFKRFQEDIHYARGVGFVQGFVKCIDPVKSILNNSSKLILSKLTSEAVYSNGQFSRNLSFSRPSGSPSGHREIIITAVDSFLLNDNNGESAINIALSDQGRHVEYKKALNLISSASQIRALSGYEKMMSWIIFGLKILFSVFGVSKNYKGFKVGTKNIEKGILVGQYLVAFGEIIYDRINKELRMDNPILFLNDKMQFINQLKRKATTLNNNMLIILVAIILSGSLFLKRVKKWLTNLATQYKKHKELTRMSKTFQISSTLSDDYKCVICTENPKNVIFRPCMHLSICKLCYDRLNEKTCPICKQDISSYIAVYIA